MIDLVIWLRSIKDPNQICNICKKHKISRFNYTFKEIVTNEILKHGLSADSTARDGDRLYRQAGHLIGWKRRLKGPNGAEMRIIAEDFEKKHGYPLHKDNVVVEIIDMTTATTEEIEALERQMINETIDNTQGIRPIGNRDPESIAYATKIKNELNLAKLFDFEGRL